MRLSEAIKQGAKGKKQITGKLFRYTRFDEMGQAPKCVCAVGAGVVATLPLDEIQASGRNALMIRMREIYPVLNYQTISPINGNLRSVEGILYMLNDHTGLTFREIVEWLETVEAEYAEKQ